MGRNGDNRENGRRGWTENGDPEGGAVRDNGRSEAEAIQIMGTQEGATVATIERAGAEPYR